jgi:MFS family permease
MRLAGRLGALQEKQFRLLWAGQAVSAFGDGLYPVALAFAVVELTGSAADLGFVFMAVLIPRVVLVLGGGVWADRLPRQRVMLGADVLRCAMQALTAVFLLGGGTELWPLLVLSALYGAGDAFFQPAITGLVPATVRPDRIQQANALLSVTRNGCWLAGPVVAGVVVTTAGSGWAFAIDAASFAVSATFLAAMRLPRRALRDDRKPFVAELRAGWREVRSRTWVWTSIVYFSVWNLAVAPMFVLGPFVAKESLGGAESWGLIVTAAGVGSLVGAAAALRLKPRRPLAIGFLLFGLCALEPALLAAPASTPVVAVAAALGFGGSAFGGALWLTALQERIPAASISRVSAYDWLGSIVFKPAGYALIGPLVAVLGTSSTLLGSAAVIAGASVVVSSLACIRAVVRPGDIPETADRLSLT